MVGTNSAWRVARSRRLRPTAGAVAGEGPARGGGGRLERDLPVADLLPPPRPARRPALRPFLAGLAAGIALTLVATSLPGDGGPGGFLNALRRPGTAQLVRDGGTTRANPRVTAKRTRPVRLDRSALFDAQGRPKGPDRLGRVGLALFEDASFTGVVERMTDDASGTTWAGPLDGDPQGSFLIVAVDDVLIGQVATARGVFEFSRRPDGTDEALEVDQGALITDTTMTAIAMPPPPVLVGTAFTTADILVLYTTAARTAEGSTTAMRARIKLATEEANLTFANSAVNLRLRLVHAEEVAYKDSGSIVTDRDALVNPGDGQVDVAQTLRDRYGADMVALVTTSYDWCGMAAGIGSTAGTAFQVTSVKCLTGNYVFAHEFGHLLGARHDVKVDATDTPYADGHAQVNFGSTDDTRWRTVMAYNDACFPVVCTRIPYWSNPSVNYGEFPTGIVDRTNNARVLNLNAPTVAAYRTPVLSGDMASPFDNAWTGWQAIASAWGLNGAGSFVSAGTAGGWGSTAYTTGTWGDIAYEVRMRRTGTCLSCNNRVVIRGTGAAGGSSYAFGYTNDGRYSVVRYLNGTATTFIGWTPSAAIARGGWNVLRVTAAGSLLRFTINGTEVWWGNDIALRTGNVGVGFYRDAAAGQLEIDYARVATAFASS